MDMNVKKVKLIDIADVKRATNQIYKKDTIYIQVSAAKRSNLKMFYKLDRDAILESKYAVVQPRIEIDAEYLENILELYAAEWHHRYVGKSINIQMSAFNEFELEYHTDLETQSYIKSMLRGFDEAIQKEERFIKEAKKYKKYMVNKMFI